jgi:hypothetical protein
VQPRSKGLSAPLFTCPCKILCIENLHFHDLRQDGVSRLFDTAGRERFGSQKLEQHEAL